MFFCEFCEISKNIFFIEYLPKTASVWGIIFYIPDKFVDFFEPKVNESLKFEEFSFGKVEKK